MRILDDSLVLPAPEHSLRVLVDLLLELVGFPLGPPRILQERLLLVRQIKVDRVLNVLEFC